MFSSPTLNILSELLKLLILTGLNLIYFLKFHLIIIYLYIQAHYNEIMMTKKAIRNERTIFMVV
jgi:hypothetical protein